MTTFITNVQKKALRGFSGTCFICCFSVKNYTDEIALQLLGEDILKPIINAVPKRKAEFVAGRYLAKKALKAIGSANYNVSIGPNREPIWPDSYQGSISHTNCEVICLVSKVPSIKLIGVDIENIITYEVANYILKDVLLSQEVKHVVSKSRFDLTMFTLIFSAKESLFKALYPQVRYFFDFSAAKITDIDMKNFRFIIELTRDLTDNLLEGSTFEGMFELNSDRVLTVINF